MARPSAPALQCLDMFSGAGELPGRLVFSCVRWAGTCCARGECHAGLSAPGTLVARSVV